MDRSSAPPVIDASVAAEEEQQRSPAVELGVRAAYAAYGDELYRFSLRVLGDDTAAQEAVRDTFVRAWRAAASYEPAAASLRAWLYTIARDVVLDRYGVGTGRPRSAEVGSIAAAAAADAVEERIAAWQVEEALRALAPEQRHAVVETYYRGRPYPEVAAEAGVPIGSLRGQVFCALRSMRTTLAEVGWAP